VSHLPGWLSNRKDNSKRKSQKRRKECRNTVRPGWPCARLAACKASLPLTQAVCARLSSVPFMHTVHAALSTLSTCKPMRQALQQQQQQQQ